ncbi:hypothetical protein THTE_2474 [Thermogutta terrifontis]|uniref:Uncharacterized protein n=1 Tax=Thermogutta terrifontis TaxID=1331910 RepID=A0A286RGK6_9BACT|nr:hypothetical protein THTE_2474 [Thermogutta terrifontis]
MKPEACDALFAQKIELHLSSAIQELLTARHGECFATFCSLFF